MYKLLLPSFLVTKHTHPYTPQRRWTQLTIHTQTVTVLLFSTFTRHRGECKKRCAFDNKKKNNTTTKFGLRIPAVKCCTGSQLWMEYPNWMCFTLNWRKKRPIGSGLSNAQQMFLAFSHRQYRKGLCGCVLFSVTHPFPYPNLVSFSHILPHRHTHAHTHPRVASDTCTATHIPRSRRG